MVGSGRLIGLILIVVGVAIIAVSGIWVMSTLGTGPGRLQSGGAALTMGCAVMAALLVAAFGVWFLMQGKTEASQFAEVEKEKRILNIVQTQGTVQLSS